jgi:hypothetical protein
MYSKTAQQFRHFEQLYLIIFENGGKFGGLVPFRSELDISM